MSKMRLLAIALFAVIVSVVYSQKDGRDMRIVTSLINDLSGNWEMRDTLVTDSGTWTITCKLELVKDSIFRCSRSHSFVTTDGSRHSLFAEPGFWGPKWDIGNWKNSSSYNILYLYSDWGEIESWRIVKRDKDTLIVKPFGQFSLIRPDMPCQSAAQWNGNQGRGLSHQGFLRINLSIHQTNRLRICNCESAKE